MVLRRAAASLGSPDGSERGAASCEDSSCRRSRAPIRAGCARRPRAACGRRRRCRDLERPCGADRSCNARRIRFCAPDGAVVGRRDVARPRPADPAPARGHLRLDAGHQPDRLDLQLGRGIDPSRRSLARAVRRVLEGSCAGLAMGRDLHRRQRAELERLLATAIRRVGRRRRGDVVRATARGNL